MRLLAVEVHRLDLALTAPVRTAAGTHAARPVLFVRVVCDDGVGWGECGALPDGTSVDPTLAQVSDAFDGLQGAARRLLAAAAARGGELPAAAQVTRLFAGTPSARMAGAALEMAVLDAELRAASVPLAARLGATAPVVPVGAMVGIPEDRRIDTLLARVDDLLGEHPRRLRMKIGPTWDLDPVAAVRAAHPDLLLQVDANGAYRLDSADADDARRLRALDTLGIGCIEQPLVPADLPGHAALAAELRTPIALDETLTSLRRVTDALRYGACGVACIKPARLGGLFEARRAVEACAAAGVGVFVGGFFETGLGRAANAAVAGLAGCTLPGDLTDPAGYLDVNPVPYGPVRDGMVVLPRGAGVAPSLDGARIEERSTGVRRYEAAR